MLDGNGVTHERVEKNRQELISCVDTMEKAMIGPRECAKEELGQSDFWALWREL